MTELRRTPLHRALHRPNLILGGEREPVLIGGLTAAGLAMVSLTWPATFIALGILGLTIVGSRMMAKHDPDAAKIYIRSLKYRVFYPARSEHWRED